MHAAKLIFAAVCSFSGIFCAAQKNFMELNFDNSSCSSADPQALLKSYSCKVSKNLKRRSFSLELCFRQNIPKFNMNLLIVLPRQPLNFVLINFTNFDGCQWLANKNQATLVTMVRSFIDRYGNMPNGCPFLRDKVYYIRNFRLDLDRVPAFSFETSLDVWFDLIVAGNKILKGYLKAHVNLKQSGNKSKLPLN